MEQHIELDRLLTVKEVAARLRLSRSGVYALIRRRALPHVNLSYAKRLAPRIRVSDLEAFICSRLTRGPREAQP